MVRLHQQLQQANLNLENEKRAKQIAKKQFDQVSQCITDLEKDISKAKSDVNTTHRENKRDVRMGRGGSSSRAGGG